MGGQCTNSKPGGESGTSHVSSTSSRKWMENVYRFLHSPREYCWYAINGSIRRLGPRKTILENCEGKLDQIYNHRMTGDGSFFPDPPGSEICLNSRSVLRYHPVLEFNGNKNDFWLMFDDSDILERHQSRPLRKPQKPLSDPQASSSRSGFLNTFTDASSTSGFIRPKDDDELSQKSDKSKDRFSDGPDGKQARLDRFTRSALDSRIKETARERRRSRSRDRRLSPIRERRRSRSLEKRRSRSPGRRRSPARDRRGDRRGLYRDRRRSRSREGRGRARSRSRDRHRTSRERDRISSKRRENRSSSSSSEGSSNGKAEKSVKVELLKKFAEKLQEEANKSAVAKKSLSSVRLSSRLEDTKLRRAEPVTPIVFSLKKAPVKAFPATTTPAKKEEPKVGTEQPEQNVAVPMEIDEPSEQVSPSISIPLPTTQYAVPPAGIKVPPPVTQVPPPLIPGRLPVPEQPLRVTDGVTVACAPTRYKDGKKAPVSSSTIALPPSKPALVSAPQTVVSQPPPVISQPPTVMSQPPHVSQPMEAPNITEQHQSLAVQALEYASMAQVQDSMMQMSHQNMGMPPPGFGPMGVPPGMMGPGHGPMMMGQGQFRPPGQFMGPLHGPEGPFMGPPPLGPEGPFMGPPPHGPEGPFMGPPPHGPEGPFMGPPPRGPEGPFMGPPPHGPEGPFMGPPPLGPDGRFLGPPPHGPEGPFRGPPPLVPDGQYTGPGGHDPPFFPTRGKPMKSQKPPSNNVIVCSSSVSTSAKVSQPQAKNVTATPKVEVKTTSLSTKPSVSLEEISEPSSNPRSVSSQVKTNDKDSTASSVQSRKQTPAKPVLSKLTIPNFKQIKYMVNLLEFLQSRSNLRVKIASLKSCPAEDYCIKDGLLCKLKKANEKDVLVIEVPVDENARRTIVTAVVLKYPDMDLEALIELFEQSFHNMPMEDIEDVFEDETTRKSSLLTSIEGDFSKMTSISSCGTVVHLPESGKKMEKATPNEKLLKGGKAKAADSFEDRVKAAEAKIAKSRDSNVNERKTVADPTKKPDGKVTSTSRESCEKPLTPQEKSKANVVASAPVDKPTSELSKAPNESQTASPLETFKSDKVDAPIMPMAQFDETPETPQPGDKSGCIKSSASLKENKDSPVLSMIKQEELSGGVVQNTTPTETEVGSLKSVSSEKPSGKQPEEVIAAKEQPMDVENSNNDTCSDGVMDSTVAVQEHISEVSPKDDDIILYNSIIMKSDEGSAETKNDRSQLSESAGTETISNDAVMRPSDVSSADPTKPEEPSPSIDVLRSIDKSISDPTCDCSLGKEAIAVTTTKIDNPERSMETVESIAENKPSQVDGAGEDSVKSNEPSVLSNTTLGADEMKGSVLSKVPDHRKQAEESIVKTEADPAMFAPSLDKPGVNVESVSSRVSKETASTTLKDDPSTVKYDHGMPEVDEAKVQLPIDSKAIDPPTFLSTNDKQVSLSDSKAPSKEASTKEQEKLQKITAECVEAKEVKQMNDDCPKVDFVTSSGIVDSSKPIESQNESEPAEDKTMDPIVAESVELTLNKQACAHLETQITVPSTLEEADVVHLDIQPKQDPMDTSPAAIIEKVYSTDAVQSETQGKALLEEAVGEEIQTKPESMETSEISVSEENIIKEEDSSNSEPQTKASGVREQSSDASSTVDIDTTKQIVDESTESVAPSALEDKSDHSIQLSIKEDVAEVKSGDVFCDLLAAKEESKSRSVETSAGDEKEPAATKVELTKPQDIIDPQIKASGAKEQSSDASSTVVMDTANQNVNESTEPVAPYALEDKPDLSIQPCITKEEPAEVKSDDVSEVIKNEPENQSVETSAGGKKESTATTKVEVTKPQDIDEPHTKASGAGEQSSNASSTVVMDTTNQIVTESTESVAPSTFEDISDLSIQPCIIRENAAEVRSDDVCAVIKENPEKISVETSTDGKKESTATKVEITDSLDTTTAKPPLSQKSKFSKFKSTYELMKTMALDEPKELYKEPDALTIINDDKLSFFYSRLKEIQKDSDIGTVTSKIPFVPYNALDQFVMKNGLLCKRKDMQLNDVFIVLVKSTVVYREIVSALTEEYPDLEFNEFMSIMYVSFAYITPDEIKSLMESIDEQMKLLKYADFIEKCNIVNYDIVKPMMEQLRIMQKADSSIAHRYSRLRANGGVDDSYILKFDVVCQFVGSIDFKVWLPNSQPDQIAIMYIVHETNHLQDLVKFLELLRATFEGVNASLINKPIDLCSVCHPPATATAASIVKACVTKCAALKSLPPAVIFKIRQIQMTSSVYKAQIDLLTKGQSRQGSRYILDTSLLCKAVTEGNEQVFRVVVSPSGLKEVVSLLHTTYHRKSLDEFISFVREFMVVTKEVCKAAFSECCICNKGKLPKTVDLPKSGSPSKVFGAPQSSEKKYPVTHQKDVAKSSINNSSMFATTDAEAKEREHSLKDSKFESKSSKQVSEKKKEEVKETKGSKTAAKMPPGKDAKEKEVEKRKESKEQPKSSNEKSKPPSAHESEEKAVEKRKEFKEQPKSSNEKSKPPSAPEAVESESSKPTWEIKEKAAPAPKTPHGRKIRKDVSRDLRAHEKIWSKELGERIHNLLHIVPDRILSDTIASQRSCPELLSIIKELERTNPIRDAKEMLCGGILFVLKSKLKPKIAVKPIKNIEYLLITKMHAEVHDWSVNKVHGTIGIAFDIAPSKEEVEETINWFCHKCIKPETKKKKKVYSSIDEQIKDFYKNIGPILEHAKSKENEEISKAGEEKSETMVSQIHKDIDQDLEKLVQIWGKELVEKIKGVTQPIPASVLEAVIAAQKENTELMDIIQSLEDNDTPVKDARHVLCGGILFVVKSKKKAMLVKIYVKPVKNINYILISTLHAACHDWTVNRVQTTIGISFDVSPSREEVAVTIEWFCSQCQKADTKSRRKKAAVTLEEQLKDFYDTIHPAMPKDKDEEQDGDIDLTQDVSAADVRIALAQLPNPVVNKIQMAQMQSNVLSTQVKLLENTDGPAKGKGYCLVMSLLCKLVKVNDNLAWRVMIPSDNLKELVVELHTAHYHDMMEEAFFDFVNKFMIVPEEMVSELFASCSLCLTAVRRVPTLCERGINEDMLRKTLANISEMIEYVLKWQTECPAIAKIREGVKKCCPDIIEKYILYKDILFKIGKAKGGKVRCKISASLLPNALDEVIKSAHAFYHSNNPNQLMNLINTTFDLNVPKDVLVTKIPEVCNICKKKAQKAEGDGGSSPGGAVEDESVEPDEVASSAAAESVKEEPEIPAEVKTEGEEPTPLGVLLLGRLCDQVIEESSNSSRALDSPVPDLSESAPVIRQSCKILIKRCKYDPAIVQQTDEGTTSKNRNTDAKQPTKRGKKPKSAKVVEEPDSSEEESDSTSLPKRKFVVYSSESETDSSSPKKRKATGSSTQKSKRTKK